MLEVVKSPRTAKTRIAETLSFEAMTPLLLRILDRSFPVGYGIPAQRGNAGLEPLHSFSLTDVSPIQETRRSFPFLCEMIC
jgi:hypothetical protein